MKSPHRREVFPNIQAQNTTRLPPPRTPLFFSAPTWTSSKPESFRQRLLIPISLLVFFLQSAPAPAQLAQDRYQLGRRLARFEKAWQSGSIPNRAASTPAMEKAVTSFFSLQLSRAGQSLDEAWMDALGVPPSDQKRWINSTPWLVDWDSPCIPSNSDPFVLRGTLKSFYSSEQPANQTQSTSDLLSLPWHVSIFSWQHSYEDIPSSSPISSTPNSPSLLPTSKPVAEFEFSPPESTDAPLEIQLPKLPPGDYLAVITLGKNLNNPELLCESFSVIENLEERIAKVETWLVEHRRDSGSTLINTTRFIAKEILKGRKGTPTESDLPWNQLLNDFEQLCNPAQLSNPAQPSASEPNSNSSTLLTWSQKPGTKWIQLAREKSSQILRVEVPTDLPKNSDSIKTIPVLIALHGAGGSENMFFETYGAGRLVALAKQRGWIVVSPRQTMSGLGMDVPKMLDALEEILPIDRNSVLLCGHSMGAAQAMSQVSRAPESIRAVAALGGGGAVRPSQAIESIPFFVAAGERDFGKPRAKTLASQLKQSNCNVDYKEYPDVEHMVIVQAALDDVFAFFDSHIPKTK